MFTPEERRIYGPYNDGHGNKVFADPAKIWRRLMGYAEGNFNAWIDRYNQSGDTDPEAAEQMAAAAIRAFDLPLFDPATGQGTLDDDALDLLSHFLDWRDQKKTPPVNSPTSALPTGQDGWPADMRKPGVYTVEAPAVQRLHRPTPQEQQRIANRQEAAIQQVGQRPPPTRRTTPSG